MSSCIATQFMQYCFSSNAGAGPPFPTTNHRGVDHHGTDPAMKIHANSALSLQIFSILSPTLSTRMPSDFPRILLERANLAILKQEVSRRWWGTSLLNVLKETDLRVGCTQCFQSGTERFRMDETTLQRRLLLCLFGLGTNTGIKSMESRPDDNLGRRHQKAW